MNSSNCERENTANQKEILDFFVRLDKTVIRLLNGIQVFYAVASALDEDAAQCSESVDALYGAIDLLECICDDFQADVEKQEKQEIL